MRAYSSFSQAPWLEKAYLDFKVLMLTTFASESEGETSNDVDCASCAEAISAISDFCDTYPPTRIIPSRHEMEEVWSHCRGLPTCIVSDALAQRLEVDGAFEWQPRLRALHFLQYLREKGGAAEVATIEVLAKSKEILDYMVDEVPQCQAIAKALLGKTDSTESTDTDLQQEVPEERSEVEEDLKSESGKQASQLRTQDLHPFLPPRLEHRERRSELQKAPSDRMQQAQEVEDDCPISLDLSSLPVLNWTEELAGNPGECNSVASEAQLEDMNVHKGLPPRTSQQSCQRPYLWLSAVGAVDLEDVKDAFSDLGLPDRIQI